MSATDKSYWHHYDGFYEGFFSDKSFSAVAEIGVYKGASIKWLLERFQSARIFGADILERQPEWPIDERFFFSRIDQGNLAQLRDFLGQADFDLIIEDGSHDPAHQALALVEGVKALSSGGIYILEDIHTCHHMHAQNRRWMDAGLTGNSLRLLLGIDHLLRRGVDPKLVDFNMMSRNSFFSPADIKTLMCRIKSVHLYRRTVLPDHCFRCGSESFVYGDLRCECGIQIFDDADSMTCVLRVR